jgi:hypothetical protein
MKKLPPWIYGTSNGALRVDTKHPEWIKFFTEFVIKNAGRIKVHKQTAPPE